MERELLDVLGVSRALLVPTLGVHQGFHRPNLVPVVVSGFTPLKNRGQTERSLKILPRLGKRPVCPQVSTTTSTPAVLPTMLPATSHGMA